MTTSIIINNVWSHVHGMPLLQQRQVNKWEDQLSGPYGITNKQGDILSGVIPALFGDDIMSCHVIDQRTIPCIHTGVPLFVDRDYQYDAIHRALSYHRGILKLPMGSGKSHIVAGLTGAFNCTHLVLVHKANLVEDLARTIKKFLNEDVGRIHGKANEYSQRIVCATYKSLYARPELLPFIQSRESIIADECHVIPALTHFTILLNTTNAYYRFGLSATPLIREDNRDIHTVGVLGPLIYEVPNESLFKQGHTIPPEVIWLDAETNTAQTEYAKGYNEAIAFNIQRNQRINQILDTCEKPAIVFVKTHKHQEQLLKILAPVHGRKVYWANQHSSVGERQRIVEAMKQNELSVVVSTRVLNDGMDVPNLRTVINGTGGASLIDAIQPSGRGSRPAENKKSFKLYDFNDQGHHWFEEHTAQRYRAYCEAGYAVREPNKLAKVVDLVPKQGNINKAELHPETAGVWYCIAWFTFIIFTLGLCSFASWLFSKDK